MDRQEYIHSGRNGVAGWFTEKDAMLWDAIDASQRERGISGDLLEIGCYQGTSAILLGYMRQDGEQVVVCDPFDGPLLSAEDEAERARYYTPNFARNLFEDNWRRFHTEMPTIIAEQSSALRRCGLERTFRFIHVDGSHAYDCVRSDLLLAKDLLLPGGVVVFDDWLSQHTPGVTIAVGEGIANDGLIPLAQSSVKFYGTWDGGVVPPHPSLPAYEHIVAGYSMVHIEG